MIPIITMDKLVYCSGCLRIFFLFFFTYLFWVNYKKQKKRWMLKRWGEKINLKQQTQCFIMLYQSVNGFVISKKARKKQDCLDYIYGEIVFDSFLALLSLAQPDTETIFYDLGSGTGKAVVACAMVYPVLRSVGIEILPELHAVAAQQAETLYRLEGYSRLRETIHFIEGDFLQADLTQATMIFINASSLFNPTWKRLGDLLNQLPQLKTIITTSKPLVSTVFNVMNHPSY